MSLSRRQWLRFSGLSALGAAAPAGAATGDDLPAPIAALQPMTEGVVAISVEESGGRVVRAGIALTGVGASNIPATEAAEALVGSPLSTASIEEAARLAAAAARPKADHRGSVEYKRHVVATFVRRGLARRQTESGGRAA